MIYLGEIYVSLWKIPSYAFNYTYTLSLKNFKNEKEINPMSELSRPMKMFYVT